jgi:hypothetical protein
MNPLIRPHTFLPEQDHKESPILSLASCCLCIKRIPDLVPAMNHDQLLSWFLQPFSGEYNHDFHPCLLFSRSRSNLKFQINLRSA